MDLISLIEKYVDERVKYEISKYTRTPGLGLSPDPRPTAEARSAMHESWKLHQNYLEALAQSIP